MPAAPDQRWTTLFTGHVQGVGFRYRTERAAGRFAVSGYVRNLSDGRVELVAEGDPGDLAALLAAVEEDMAGYIRDRQTRHEPATGEFREFGIRH